jgi:tol-pal system protein YbgF|tara:strand:+ start:475 stop:1116 length:642 start_codon:yes stop_codon:yes gene_type:complete
VLRFFLILFLSLYIVAQESSDKEFIELYLKIQNLEKEIATLRNEIEIIQTQLDFYQEKNLQKINEIDSKLISLMSIEDLQKSEAIVERDDQILNSYDQAILLIRKGQLNEALSALNAFVQTNNDSDDTPLAYFWMGEINLTNGNLAVATQNFNTLVGLYPTHWKVPLAKFKLGTIYFEQGNKERAVALFESVIKEYPDSSAAKASAETLSSLE